MIKRTLYFGNPFYLSLTNAQLVLRLPEVEKNEIHRFALNDRNFLLLSIYITNVVIPTKRRNLYIAKRGIKKIVHN
jgi:CRISPR-associated protein Cas1